MTRLPFLILGLAVLLQSHAVLADNAMSNDSPYISGGGSTNSGSPNGAMAWRPSQAPVDPGPLSDESPYVSGGGSHNGGSPKGALMWMDPQTPAPATTK
jgi:hypothetical protein